MELCWTCPPCLKELKNLASQGKAEDLQPVMTINNNNKTAESDCESEDSPRSESPLGPLTFSLSRPKRKVTFAESRTQDENPATDLLTQGGSPANCDHPDMCIACESQRQQRSPPSPSSSLYEGCEDCQCGVHPGMEDFCFPAASGRSLKFVNPEQSEQFAEETDSSHVGPPGLQQLIQDMLIPTEILVNNGIIPVDTDNAEVQNLFIDAFLHNNRLEHMIQVMGYHPHYLECFLKTQQYLLRGDGPLRYDYRHYIAIMAAGRHQCSYLIKIQTAEFLLQGGDETWLKGLEYIPQKLRDLYDVNKILAHRPWLLNKSHIEKLTKGTENWSMSELMHALTLLAHFHALASFVYGCGISAEIDQEEGHTYRIPSVSENGADHSNDTTPNSSVESNGGGIEALMRKMRQLTEEAASTEMTQEELLKRFEKIESQSAELPAGSKQPSLQADILRYVEDPEFMYEDFARRGQPTKFPCFRAQDYSWEEQGFSLANRLYTEIGTYLDDKFRMAFELTYHTMGHCIDVDTSSFRRAIWYYIHSMYGIRHDDYDYNEVNQLVERSLKAYIKTVTCFPERVTKKDYDSFMKEFKHSEKVHVNLMLLEAKMQAELLYALRAIMKFMT